MQRLDMVATERAVFVHRMHGSVVSLHLLQATCQFTARHVELLHPMQMQSAAEIGNMTERDPAPG